VHADPHSLSHALAIAPVAGASLRVQVAEEIREVLNLYDQMYPTILEIPSKDHPYSAEKDYIMKRVMHMLGK
jgi:vacuolar-type H+-ATPase subunit F/Vma7